MQLHTKHLGILAALSLLMAATRFNHFGSSLSLPDASLAVFLLAGMTVAQFSWQALIVFAFLILEAGGVDYYAINVAGTSDWCMSPAYWFLIPSYASMWLGGHWFAKRNRYSLNSLVLFTGVSWLTTTVAFMISNASFFLLSGRFSEMSISEYIGRIAQFYSPYLAGSMTYLALAALAAILLNNLINTTTNVSQS